MAKKHKEKDADQVPNPNSVSNRDILQRLNFLYQASVYLNSVSPRQPSTSNDIPKMEVVRDGEKHKKKKKLRSNVISTTDLSRSYIKSMKIVGQKTTVKMDPSVKRTLCKGCNIVLMSGSTATIRVKSSPSHGHAVTYTCTSCNTSRRIPAPPTLFPEQLDVSITSPSTSQPTQSAQEQEHMSIDPPQIEAQKQNQATKKNLKRKKKPPIPRLPPLFARDVGHIVFRGNERLDG